MAEPVFKLLRCDAEASHMLGWAKKEVRRLVGFARLDAFNRTWKFGDVSVRAQYFGGVARLALKAEATERMAVWATLPNPYPYKAIFVAESDIGLPSVVITDSTSTPWLWGVKITQTYTMYNGRGEVLKQWQGTQTPGGSSEDKSITFSTWFFYGLHNGAYSYQGVPFFVVNSYSSELWFVSPDEFTSSASSVSTMYASPTSPSYTEVLAQDAATASTQVRVFASDAQVLATEGVTRYVVGSGPSAENHTEYVATPYAGNTWFIPMFNHITGAVNQSTWDHVLTFDPPEDVIAPLMYAGMAYPTPGVCPGTDQSYAATFQAEWEYARNTAAERRQAWFKKNSDEVLQALQSGLGAAEAWSTWLKYLGPPSTHVRRRVPISITYDDVVLTSDAEGNYLHQRTARLAYEVTTEETVVVHECTITGTHRGIVTPHTYISSGSPYGTSRVQVYENWYIPPGDSGPASAESWYVPIDFLSDKITATPSGMGMFWSGQISSRYYGPVVYADSSFGIAPTEPVLGVTPPVPNYVNTMRGEAPEFLLGWHAASAQQYDKAYTTTQEERAWTTTKVARGGAVAIVPLACVLRDGDVELGMFADNRDYTAGQVKLRVRGFATLSHKYSTGALEWKRWTPLPEAQEYVDIDPPEGQYPLPNALVIYGGIKWDDVKEQARDQRKALKDPEDPAHDPLMKAVLDALTTQQ